MLLTAVFNEMNMPLYSTPVENAALLLGEHASELTDVRFHTAPGGLADHETIDDLDKNGQETLDPERTG